jgi:uncharacterized protein YqgC (DUF456 family)
MTILLWVLGIALVAVGLVGVIMPALPGTILIVVGLSLAAWADGFTRVGVWTLVLIGVIGAASYAVDFVAAALGAKRMGASPRAVVGAGLGTLLGLFFGLPGLIFGPLVGAVLGELSAHRDFKRAGKAGMAAWIGFAIGTAVKIALSMSMIAIFLAALFWF